MRTLKPSVSLLQKRSPVATVTVERIRGHALQRRNKRFLHHNPLCVHCLQQGTYHAAGECDHMIPLWAGGNDDEANIQGLCHACHLAKSTREIAERMAGGVLGQ